MINIINFPGFLSLLTLIFVAGKVFGFLSWSWWWVFSPLWIIAGIIIIITIIFFLAVWWYG